MASIKKRQTNTGPRWEVRVRKAGLPTQPRTFKHKSDAQRWIRQLENEADLCLPIVDSSIGDIPDLVTLRDVLKHYQAVVTPGKRGHEAERHRINKICRHALALIPLRKLSSFQIALYRDERLQEVSGASVLKELGLISHALDIARREWNVFMAGNPVSMVRKPKYSRARERRLCRSTQEENRLLSACLASQTKWLLELVLIALETGMRRGELLSMTWDNVDLERAYVHLEITKNGMTRDVPLSRKAIEVLSSVKSEANSNQVFPVHKEALKSAWQRACAKASLCDFHFHDLRHEATNRMFEKGLGVAEVATITGHKDYRVLQKYTHLRAEDLACKLG